MYKNYYVNKISTGNPNFNHEVHAEGCVWMPSAANRQDLGCFSSCAEAVRKAKTLYTNVDGCATCCPSCHHG